MNGVTRVDQLVLIERLNEYERVVPIYRAALEHIGVDDRNAGAVAREALREAERGQVAQ